MVDGKYIVIGFFVFLFLCAAAFLTWLFALGGKDTLFPPAVPATGAGGTTTTTNNVVVSQAGDIVGCMDQSAQNYSASATMPSISSCTYVSGPSPTTVATTVAAPVAATVFAGPSPANIFAGPSPATTVVTADVAVADVAVADVATTAAVASGHASFPSSVNIALPPSDPNSAYAAIQDGRIVSTKVASSASDCDLSYEKYFYCQQPGTSTDNFDYCGQNEYCPVNSVNTDIGSACCYCGGCLAAA